MKTKNHQHGLFHIGDRVQVDFGSRKLTGIVVEDAGPIGAGGRRILRVNIPMDPDDPMQVEIPEEELAAAKGKPSDATDLSKEKIGEYLENGGLVSILRTNTGGRTPPAVWLCLDNLGNVTHTFIPERGLIGGQAAPLLALHGNHVFTPKKDLVESFVESFGLNRRQAQDVVSAVGTVP